jgi:hypothetical protein
MKPALLIAQTGWLGGAERVLLDWALAIERPVLLACPDGPLADAAVGAGLQVLALPERSLRRRGRSGRAAIELAGLARDTGRMTRRHRPAVVVASGQRPILAAASAPLSGARLIALHHDLPPRRIGPERRRRRDLRGDPSAGGPGTGRHPAGRRPCTLDAAAAARAAARAVPRRSGASQASRPRARDHRARPRRRARPRGRAARGRLRGTRLRPTRSCGAARPRRSGPFPRRSPRPENGAGRGALPAALRRPRGLRARAARGAGGRPPRRCAGRWRIARDRHARLWAPLRPRRCRIRGRGVAVDAPRRSRPGSGAGARGRIRRTRGSAPLCSARRARCRRSLTAATREVPGRNLGFACRAAVT